jgi:hypothetical protein
LRSVTVSSHGVVSSYVGVRLLRIVRFATLYRFEHGHGPGDLRTFTILIGTSIVRYFICGSAWRFLREPDTHAFVTISITAVRR